MLPYLADDFNHLETHFNAVFGVVGCRVRDSRDAVVTITEDFDP